MIITMHGQATRYSNIKTDIRLAKETGYEALVINSDKLTRYLEAGYTENDLLSLFQSNAILPVCIDDIRGIERLDREEHNKLMDECEFLCSIAQALKCPTIQLITSNGLLGRPWKEIRELTAKNIAKLADIAAEHGIRFQLEPMAWAPINSISRSLEVIEAAERNNVGMNIDFWHLWAGSETTPDEVAEMKPSLIYGVHFCDGVRPEGNEWNENELRGYLVNDGKVPIKDWVDAVRATGYDGMWAAEVFSPKFWEWDLKDIAIEGKKRMMQYLG